MLSIALFKKALNREEELIVPPAGVPNQGLIKNTMLSMAFTKKKFLRGVFHLSCQKQLMVPVTSKETFSNKEECNKHMYLSHNKCCIKL